MTEASFRYNGFCQRLLDPFESIRDIAIWAGLSRARLLGQEQEFFDNQMPGSKGRVDQEALLEVIFQEFDRETTVDPAIVRWAQETLFVPLRQRLAPELPDPA